MDMDKVREAGQTWVDAHKNGLITGIEALCRVDAFTAGFQAGAAWQKERDTRLVDEAINTGLYVEQSFQDDVRDALGTIGEGMAELMKRQDELQAAGYRGADRGVAILKHLQEIGDNVRGVAGAIGDKFGVVLDAVRHVGETTEAVLDQVMPQEVNAMEAVMTEPMHARVKASGYYDPGNLKPLAADESGLGKLWADVTVNLEDVSDETLADLHCSGQLSTARYVEERGRRIAAKIDLGKGLVPLIEETERRVNEAGFKAINDKMAAGEPFELADLRRQLETAKMLEAFWRKVAAARGGRIKTLADQVMDMGEMVDALTGRATGA